MLEYENKNILIVGSSAKDYALIEKFKSLSFVGDIFITTSDKCFSKIAKLVDIRIDNPKEILEFVLENNISMTIVTSEKAMNSDIETLFTSNGQPIFSPSKLASLNFIDKALCKKFLYKMNIKTPKFAIFEKEQLAIDYLENVKYPIIISSKFGAPRYAVSTISGARTFIKDLFFSGEEQVVIEEYIYGNEFSYYFLTDGYKVLPICTTSSCKFLEENIGGYMSDGIGGFAPNYRLSAEVKCRLEDIAESITQELEKNRTPYTGILGIDGVLSGEDDFFILGISTFLKDHDANTVLKLIDENIYYLFESCINGNFSDDYEEIAINDNYAISCELRAKYDNRNISGFDELDEDNISLCGLNFDNNGNILSSKEQKLILTQTGKTLTSANKKLFEDIESLKFEGKTYKKNILTCS